jgi:hypothetical protein
MKNGDYKGTWLYKEQYDFIYDWLNTLEQNKHIRQKPRNLKLFCEKYFFYIAGDDLHQIMKEVGIKGDRWFHNVSINDLKKIETMLNERKRPWYQNEKELFEEIERIRNVCNISSNKKGE